MTHPWYTPGFESCPECEALRYGRDPQTAEAFATHDRLTHAELLPDYTWLTEGTEVQLHDRGFGDSLQTVEGHIGTVERGYAPGNGVLVQLRDAGTLTWVHPSECEPGVPDWRSRRLLVTGSRNWADTASLRAGLDQLVSQLSTAQPVTLVSGACPTGADHLAEQHWEELGWPIERHPADFARFGKRGFYLRNALMARLGAGACAAFPIGKSAGTRMTMKLATSAGIPVYALEGDAR